MTILTPTPMNGQVAADRARFAAQFRLSAGLSKAVDRLDGWLLPGLTKDQAVEVATNVLRDALCGLRPDMTVNEILGVLMQEGR